MLDFRKCTKGRIGALIIAAMFILSIYPSAGMQSISAEREDAAGSIGDEGVLPAPDAMEFTYHFPPPKLEFADGYASITMPGLQSYGSQGEPILPFKTARLLLPPSANVQSISVLGSGRSVLDGSYDIIPGQRSVTLSQGIKSVWTPPDEDIYSSSNPYPGQLYSTGSTQQFRGYGIHILNLYPVQYVPQSGTITYYEEISVKITTAHRAIDTHDAAMLRHSPIDEMRVKQMVDNPGATTRYKQTTETRGVAEGSLSSIVDPSDTYEYVIITNEELKASSGSYTFQDLVDSKTIRGLNATIVTVEEIVVEQEYWDSNPLFNDTQAQIRNFIKDAYVNWNTEYILLGGDGDLVAGGQNIVPIRGFYAYCLGEALSSGEFLEDDKIPSDLYYACLDGNFNSDEDIFWAEPTDGTDGGEVDLVAEVFTGRAPVDNETEVSNFVMKTLSYENATDPYLGEMLMVGEWLGFGGDAEYAGKSMDEIKDGSDAHGYTTAGIPDEYYVSTLYAEDAAWTASDLTGIINNGTHIVNGLGHAWIGLVMKMRISDVDKLTNNKYFFGYSQGCYPGAFDNNDCIIEHLVCNPTGAFAFVANTRYGIGKYESTDGAGNRYNRQFFDALYGESIRNLGRANQDSKEDNIGYLHNGERDSCDMRWCYYEITLFGDPEISIKDRSVQDHDVTVTDITAPTNSRPGAKITVNATIYNAGTNDESDIDIYLSVNGVVDNSTAVASVQKGMHATVCFDWTAPGLGEYEIELDVSPVPGESITKNNRRNTTVVAASYPDILVTPETLKITGEPRNIYEEALNETVYGPSTAGETGPMWLDNSNIINCTLYLDVAGTEWYEMEENNDYTINYTTGEIDTTPFEPYDDGWVFYAHYTYCSTEPIEAGIAVGNAGTANLDFAITDIVNASWLSVHETGGSVAVGNQTDLTLSLTTELEAGTYFGGIIITSNDLDNARIVVPVELEMLLPQHDISIGDFVAPTTTEVGETTYANVTVHNKGASGESNLAVDFNVNGVTKETTAIPYLASGGSTDLDFPWTPGSTGVYAIEIRAATIAGENLTINNHVEKSVTAAVYRVHNLDKGTRYPTIQSGIDDASAGHEIFVESGTYTERILINKSVQLRGESWGNTFIDGEGNTTVNINNARWVDISGLTIQNASRFTESGILLYASMVNVTDCVITGNNDGIRNYKPYSYFRPNLLVSNCSVEGNNNDGIVLEESTRNMIIDSMIQSNALSGISVKASSNNLIANSTFIGNNVGITIINSRNDTLDNNTASFNDDMGFYFLLSTGCIVSNNTMANNMHGIYLLSGSNSNTIRNNNMSENINYAVYLADSESNKIYLNEFFNNTKQAYDDKCNNRWDNGYPSGGNYWGDYSGIDHFYGPAQDQSGPDGVGDAPYLNIQGGTGALDRYPLMTPGVLPDPPLADFRIPVVLGWNLISVPTIPFDSALLTSLRDNDGDTLWDRAMRYDVGNSIDHWQQHNTNWLTAWNDFKNADNTMGIWINITNLGDGYLNLTGIVASATRIPLRAGWNLVGYPSLCANITVGNAFWGTGADCVEVFDQGAPYRTKVVGPAYIMKPGEGYWVHVQADSVWTVDW
ncbi:MAG: C25 family cysteine peptidase [Methanobacteriota archaeon]